MDSSKFERLSKLLEELKKSKPGGVSSENLTSETKELMEAVKAAIVANDFSYRADNGYGDGVRPLALPGYNRIPDFAVDRNKDGLWDLIIEIKSSTDWDCSDDQLKDFVKFCKERDMDFFIVVPESLFEKAKVRYEGIGIFKYAKFKLVPVG